MKIKKKEILIAGFTFLVGLIAHFFIISNPLFNADGIFYSRSMGAGSIFGRWLIEIFNDLFKVVGYSAVIPMLNIIAALLILSFTSIYVIRLLKVDNTVFRAIVSVSLVLSPAIIQTFFYGFTAHIYAFSILFTVLAIYQLIEKHNEVFSICLNCLALAIYQAYIPFMICLYILVYIKLLIDEDIKTVVKIIIKSVICFVISFAMYMMINAIINRKYDNYIYALHGMSEYIVPKFTISSFLASLGQAIKANFDIFLRHNVFAHNTTIFIRIIYFFLIILSIVTFVLFIRQFAFKRSLYANEKKILRSKAIFMIVLYIILPIAMNFMFIMTNNGLGYIEDRMSYSYVFYIITPIVFLDLIYNDKKILGKKLRLVLNVPVILCIVILLHNFWLAYGSYYNQFKVINASKSFALELATTIKMLPGYNENTNVLFIGSPYKKNEHSNYGYYVDAEHNLYSNFDVEYENILSEYPMEQVFKEFTALDFKPPEADFGNNLYYSKTIRDMPLYPFDGSVKMVENVAVVKFRDPTF